MRAKRSADFDRAAKAIRDYIACGPLFVGEIADEYFASKEWLENGGSLFEQDNIESIEDLRRRR